MQLLAGKKTKKNIPQKTLLGIRHEPYSTPCPFEGSSSWAASSALYCWQLPSPSSSLKATAAPSSVRFVASVPSLCGRNDWKGRPQAEHLKLGLHFLILQQGWRHQELGTSALNPASKTILDQIFSSHHPKEADATPPADRASGQGAQRSPSKL